MSLPGSRLAFLRGERGFTLVELLVAMSLGVIVLLAAWSLLDFTTKDVSRISDRVQADQAGRVALENIMLALHSACVAPTVTPVLPGSSETVLKFISEKSSTNSHGEPVSSLLTVRLHKIVYTPASGKTEGTLTEESWPSTGTTPEYKFNEKETPTKIKLLSGIKLTEGTPLFRYYRYYREGDIKPVYGQLNPTQMTTPLEKETEAEEVAKVRVAFTLAPEGKENTTFGNDRPVAFEDSAILRLAPSSEASGSPNLPCTQQT